MLALQVHDLTGSGLAVSGLFATTLVPAVAVAPLAGLAADRFESVRVLVAASLIQAAVAAPLASARIWACSSLWLPCSPLGTPSASRPSSRSC
ncbi:MAG: MFS transporter, partial [Actinomycetota bacterium]|nr:MFS transporter [Actinomycetota bacterium]